ncbi:MAG: GIY-YIG nuclease family protein [Cyclobacteriaceae bacterium]|nr:GIY-YIG nuclease family protein [Cyclobacteriaceae bacterium]
MKKYYVYIISNQHYTVFYTGFTNDLGRRIEEHKLKVVKGFSYKYNCNKLLYYEEFGDMQEALHREKQLKRYRSLWKKNLINKMNSTWRDLYNDFIV